MNKDKHVLIVCPECGYSFKSERMDNPGTYFCHAGPDGAGHGQTAMVQVEIRHPHFVGLTDEDIRNIHHGLEVARCQFEEGLDKPKHWSNTSSQEAVDTFIDLERKLGFI